MKRASVSAPAFVASELTFLTETELYSPGVTSLQACAAECGLVHMVPCLEIPNCMISHRRWALAHFWVTCAVPAEEQSLRATGREARVPGSPTRRGLELDVVDDQEKLWGLCDNAARFELGSQGGL